MSPILLTAAAGAGNAAAQAIHTGGETGAYHSTFCPMIEKALGKAQFAYKCTTSDGSRDNIQKVISAPGDIGFSQLDVFALERGKLGTSELLQPLRTDLGRECLFMVTKNKDIKTYGEVQALAGHLRFILPQQKSGAAATFEFLKSIDPQGLGLATTVINAADTDDAIRMALSAEDSVTLFVQFPDPKNARFKAIEAMGGHFVPVIDRTILRQDIDGEKIYYADETEVAQPKWTKTTPKVVTACTPMVLFTGLSSLVEDGTKRQDHQDLVRTLKSLPIEELQPKQGFFSRLWKKTKELSGQSVEKMVEVSEQAKEAAKPMVEKTMKKAKELTDQATEEAKKLIEKGKDAIGSGTGDTGE